MLHATWTESCTERAARGPSRHTTPQAGLALIRRSPALLSVDRRPTVKLACAPARTRGAGAWPDDGEHHMGNIICQELSLLDAPRSAAMCHTRRATTPAPTSTWSSAHCQLNGHKMLISTTERNFAARFAATTSRCRLRPGWLHAF